MTAAAPAAPAFKVGDKVVVKKSSLWVKLHGKTVEVIGFTSGYVRVRTPSSKVTSVLIKPSDLEAASAIKTANDDDFKQVVSFFFKKPPAPKCPRCGTNIVDPINVITVRCASYKCHNFDKKFTTTWTHTTYGAPRVDGTFKDAEEVFFLGQFLHWDLYWTVDKMWGSLIQCAATTGQKESCWYQGMLVEPLPKAHFRHAVTRAIARKFPHVKAGA
jgi:hypothetical protein